VDAGDASAGCDSASVFLPVGLVFVDPPVIISPLEEARGLFVEDEDRARVHLEHGRRDHRRERTFDGRRYGPGLLPAEGQEQARPAGHDRPQAHGDDVVGHLVHAAEQGGIVAARLLGQRLDPRPRGQRGRELVEAEMAVRPDTEDLDVDAAGGVDPLLVARAAGRDVRGQPVRDVHPVCADVDVAKKVLAHIAVVGAGVGGVETGILVEVEGRHLAEIQPLRSVHFDEDPVHLERRLSRGEAEDGVRLFPDEGRRDFGGDEARLAAVGLDDDFHSRIIAEKGRMRPAGAKKN